MDNNPARVVHAELMRGLCYRLFELDQFFAGDGYPLRLKREQYDEARRGIAILFHVAKHADLEPTPASSAASKAKADPAFQRFLLSVQRGRIKRHD